MNNHEHDGHVSPYSSVSDSAPEMRLRSTGRKVTGTLTAAAGVVHTVLICAAFILAPALRALLPVQGYGAPLGQQAAAVLADLDQTFFALIIFFFVPCVVLTVLMQWMRSSNSRQWWMIPRMLSLPALFLYLWAVAPAVVTFMAESGAVGS